MSQGIQFAVVGATYHRKNGETAMFLRRVFRFLQKQTYQNFKLFLIGDDYIPEIEFNDLCATFPEKKIYYKNYKGISYRKGVFRKTINTWTCGGAQAKYIGIKKAIEEGYKYYLHLDDDDIWYANHIQEHYDSIKKYPEVDFQFTIAKYVDDQLPLKIEKCLPTGYNNLIPRPHNVVHSSWCINLHTMGPRLLEFFETRMKTIDDIRHKKKPETVLGPMDAKTLIIIRDNVVRGIWKCVFIPKVTCCKPTESNVPR